MNGMEMQEKNVALHKRFDITRENKGEQLGVFNEIKMTERTPFVGKNHETSGHWNKNERYKSRKLRHSEHI